MLRKEVKLLLGLCGVLGHMTLKRKWPISKIDWVFKVAYNATNSKMMVY